MRRMREIGYAREIETLEKAGGRRRPGAAGDSCYRRHESRWRLLRQKTREKLRGALDALAAGDPLDDKRVAGGATDEVRVG